MKFGALGGFTPGWLKLDVGPVNDFLQAGKGAALSSDGMILLGGAGAAYIMVVPNLRIGGWGMSGSLKSTSLEEATGIRRDAELNAGFGGVTVEYVFPIVERLDVAVGAMLGGGGIDLTLRRSNGGNITWADEQNSFGSNLSSPLATVTTTLTGSYFVWIPSVNVEYAILGWLGVRLGASYVGMSAPSWKADSKYELLGVPTKVSGKGFMINTGIMFGTF